MKLCMPAALLIAATAFASSCLADEPKGSKPVAPKAEHSTDGRYVLGQSADPSIAAAFVIDTRTGKVWRITHTNGGETIMPMIYEDAPKGGLALPK